MKIIIPGKPIPKHRPRFAGNHAYNDQSQIMNHYAHLIRCQYGLAYALPGPIEISVLFFMPLPAKCSKKLKAKLFNQYHDKKPDIDNCLKFIFDVISLSQAVYKDDRQIASVISKKLWSDNPRTEIDIYSLPEDI